MDIQISSRHFKARQSLLDHVESSIQELQHIYDGIINAKVNFDIEPHNDGKIAEISLMVYHDTLFAKETSDDFEKSLNVCVEKLERQLRKYKEKLTDKGRGHRPAEEILSADKDEYEI